MPTCDGLDEGWVTPRASSGGSNDGRGPLRRKICPYSELNGIWLVLPLGSCEREGDGKNLDNEFLLTYFGGAHPRLIEGVLQHNGLRVGEEHYDAFPIHRAALALAAIVKGLRKA
jgi:hypothetical protein